MNGSMSSTYIQNEPSPVILFFVTVNVGSESGCCSDARFRSNNSINVKFAIKSEEDDNYHVSYF